MADHQYATTIGLVGPTMARPSILAQGVVITLLATTKKNSLIAVIATVNKVYDQAS